MWGLGAAFFLAEYLARVAPAVMVPDLMNAFQITALGIGSMSAFFYYAYVGMQIPVGILVDRFGPHRLLTLMAAICALSAMMFGFSHSLVTAHLARFLMGFSSAFAFVGSLRLATLWFSSRRFGLLAGLTQALGMFGAAMAGGPLALVVDKIGWRYTMAGIGGVLLILALLIGIFVRDRSIKHTSENKLATSQELWKGLRLVLKNKQSWLNALFVGLLYAPTAAFAELWGVSFLVRVYGLHNEIAATAISCIFIGWAVGAPITGWISDRIQKRKPILMFSVIASLILILLVIYLPSIKVPILFVLLFFYGVANTGVATAYAVASEINPRHVAGSSMAFANMASVLIGAAFQPVIGLFLDLQWHGEMSNGVPFYSVHAFRFAMSALPLCLILGSIIVFKIKETHCKLFDEF